MLIFKTDVLPLYVYKLVLLRCLFHYFVQVSEVIFLHLFTELFHKDCPSIVTVSVAFLANKDRKINF